MHIMFFGSYQENKVMVQSSVYLLSESTTPKDTYNSQVKHDQSITSQSRYQKPIKISQVKNFKTVDSIQMIIFTKPHPPPSMNRYQKITISTKPSPPFGSSSSQTIISAKSRIYSQTKETP